MQPVLTFGEMELRAAELGQQSSVPDLLGEMILQNNLKFELDEKDEIYEAYGRKATVYPYRQQNGYTRKLSEQKVRTAVLENDWLKAVFLPEYGGRLWKLWDKEAERDLLYTNDVLRFSNLAVRNAWFSGGVEWNIGVIGHTPLTAEPLYTAQTETEKGEPVLRMYEYERIRGVVYQMDFWLEKRSRFLNCRMRIVNENSKVIPMYWWSNIAVPEYEGGQITVPAESAYTNGDGVVYKVSIPVVKGKDVTEYHNIEKSVDYFFDIPEKNPKYIFNMDKNGYGLMQISTKRLVSRKLFSWGNSDGSNRWQEFLTEEAGRYLEIQAGLAKTQYGCIPMAPHTAWEWIEQYGAVQLSDETRQMDHEERSKFIIEKMKRKRVPDKLEQMLNNTDKMAKTKAELIWKGRGYGAMEEHGRGVSHLEFEVQEKSLEKWKRFFETGILHCSDPLEVPDEFLITEENLAFLKKNILEKNSHNWYAFYHLGIGYFVSGKYKKAKKAFRESLEIEENPWALHGLSCIYLLQEKRQKAVSCIKKGMTMRAEDLSYMKEGFRILLFCEAYDDICNLYKELNKKLRKNNRICFVYISALHKLGKDEKAYRILEKDGGMILEDIREGEDSIGQLWSELYGNLFGETAEIPHKFNFKSI